MSSSTPQPRTVLLLIDIQEGFHHPSYWGPSRSNPSFQKHASSLITTYRSLIATTSSQTSSSPHKVIHIQHSSTENEEPRSPLLPTSPGFAIQSWAAPNDNELLIVKNVHSAFIGTNLEEVLKKHFYGEPGKLWIAGLSTDHCVSTTTRMAGDMGICDAMDGRKGDVILVEDATAAWKKSDDGFDAEMVHSVHVESLRDFASIGKTEEVLDLWKRWIAGTSTN